MNTMTLQQERELKAANLEIWETKVTPLAVLMMDGHTERKHKSTFSFDVGLEMDEVVLTDEGEQATLLIAAGKFVEAGQILQKAMFENCLENACYFLDLDIEEVRP
jgi:hypothetical protein